MAIHRDIQRVIDAALEQGWRAVPAMTSHTRLLSPDGRTQVTAPATPSDWRSVQNTISQMRRGGFKWKGR